MTTTTISHPSSSLSLFTQLVRRLRVANARYDLIAYQCRRAQRPTYHAKRRADRAGLRIDTSKARVACLGAPVLVSVSAASARGPGVPAWVVTETDTDTDTESMSCWSADSEETHLPNPWLTPAHVPRVVVRKQPLPATCLSPLQLALCGLDEVNVRQWAPLVPGAPRWQSRPLPKDGMTYESWSPEVACTYDPVWRRVTKTRVGDSMGVMGAGRGVVAPQRHLKRKLDVDADEGASFYRQRCPMVTLGA